MARVTGDAKDGAVACKVVWFDIKGPKDTMIAFHKWLGETERFPMRGTGTSGPVALGPGRVSMKHHFFSGAFYLSDADAVTEWLETHGLPVTQE